MVDPIDVARFKPFFFRSTFWMHTLPSVIFDPESLFLKLIDSVVPGVGADLAAVMARRDGRRR